MQETSRKAGLGAKTLDREVRRYLGWVAENLPNLAMRHPPEVRRVIVRALNETRVARTAIGLIVPPTGIVFALWAANTWLGESSLGKWVTAGAVVGAAVVAYLSIVWANTLVHGKIESLANDS